MPVSMPSVATTTQTVTILTDVQNLHPTIVCPITAILTPSAAFISLSGDYKTISVIAGSIVLPTDIGTNQFVLTVNSLNYLGSVSQ